MMLKTIKNAFDNLALLSKNIDLNAFYLLMWSVQEDFLAVLIEKQKLPQFPLDLSTKQNQQIVRDLLRDAADELHEARLTLKNSKSHRSSEETDFDRNHFIEEIVDSIKFCLGALIYAGVSPKEFVEVFLKKSLVNLERQKTGY